VTARQRGSPGGASDSVRPSTASGRTAHLQHGPSRPHVYRTAGVKLSGPERSEGHVSSNDLVRQPPLCSPIENTPLTQRLHQSIKNEAAWLVCTWHAPSARRKSPAQDPSRPTSKSITVPMAPSTTVDVASIPKNDPSCSTEQGPDSCSACWQELVVDDVTPRARRFRARVSVSITHDIGPFLHSEAYEPTNACERGLLSAGRLAFSCKVLKERSD